MDQAPLRESDPATVGPYRLLGRLGQGGMGTVYLGVRGDEKYAIKLIRPELGADEGFRSRFGGEVANARKVAAFCTASVLDDGEHDGRPYLVTEYVPGPSLDAYVAEHGSLPASALHGVAVGVAAALTAIHAAGLVHRDLKPANVLLSLSGPRVIDFGIARALDAASVHTLTGHVMGSPGWIAPEELLKGGPGAVTTASDVFAWGCLVAYAGTGRHPFGDTSDLAAVALATIGSEPRLDGLPDGLRATVADTLVKDPERRPSARDLLLRLVGADAATDTPTAVTAILGRAWPPTLTGPPTGLTPTPPGHAPPGHALPGGAQPGHASPGIAQPGHAQPGAAPPGNAPLGNATPGAPPGHTPAGHAPPGHIPRGQAAPRQMAPQQVAPGSGQPGPGMPQPGAGMGPPRGVGPPAAAQGPAPMAPASIPPGPMPPAPMPPGPVPPGSMPPGPMPPGPMASAPRAPVVGPSAGAPPGAVGGVAGGVPGAVVPVVVRERRRGCGCFAVVALVVAAVMLVVAVAVALNRPSGGRVGDAVTDEGLSFTVADGGCGRSAGVRRACRVRLQVTNRDRAKTVRLAAADQELIRRDGTATQGARIAVRGGSRRTIEVPPGARRTVVVLFDVDWPAADRVVLHARAGSKGVSVPL